ncbi:MAG: hydroxymethylbilane synthase [Planctomycetes bacterium]|nr:hydroxymethylbilane synthase [Planctomycetota bacterium]
MIVFGSRSSELALTQTRHVAALLRARTGAEVRIEVLETTGDRVTERPLAAIGVKGAFTVELEEALRAGRIAAAVHSLKDLPVDDPPDLVLGAIPERVDPTDVLLVAPHAHDPGAGALPLRHSARVGTSSPRRGLALQALRGDLRFLDIRGNVPTRVAKVRRGDYDAALFAAAGLDRLGLDLGDLRRVPVPIDLLPPAPGQGALAVQCRRDDQATRALLAAIHDAGAARCVQAERDLLAAMGGGCSLPLGVLATAEPGGEFRLQAALFGGSPAVALRADQRGTDLPALVRTIAAPWAPLIGAPLHGQRVLVLRPGGMGGDLAQSLAVAGASVECVAWTRTEELPPDRTALAAVCAAPALAFTSARAVERFAALAPECRRALAAARTFAVGAATAAALRAAGASPLVADGSGGSALAAHLAAALPRGSAVGFPCALERHAGLERDAAAAGLRVVPLPLYRTVADPAAPDARGPADVVLLTSPSAVRAWLQRPRRPVVRHCVAIGPATAAAMRDAGLRVAAEAPRADLAPVVAALRTCLPSAGPAPAAALHPYPKP